MANDNNPAPGAGLSPNPAPEPVAAPPSAPAIPTPKFGGGIEPGSLRGRGRIVSATVVSADEADEEFMRQVSSLSAKEFKEKFLGPTEKAKVNWRKYQDVLARRGK